MSFCPSCGSQFNEDDKFCPRCGKQVDSTGLQLQRPIGITILAVLHLIIGIILAISTVTIGVISGNMMGYSMMGYSMIGHSMMGGIFGALGGIITAVIGALAAIYLVVAWALFNGKSWARTIIIILTVIDLVFGSVTLALGNVFEIGSIILDLVVLYYMWRPHVMAYFHVI